MDFLVGKEMVEQWMSTDIENLLKNLNTTCKIIFAGNYNKHKLWKPFLEIRPDIKSVIIEGASHGFIEEGTEKKLFEKTLELLDY